VKQYLGLEPQVKQWLQLVLLATVFGQKADRWEMLKEGKVLALKMARPYLMEG